MKIAYIEDDEKEIAILKEYLMEILSEDFEFSAFSSDIEFFNSWKNEKYHIIFLDIYLKDTLGIDIARKIRESDEDVHLAFCSSSNDFATESYEVKAKYYLQKPFTKKNIKEMIYRINIDEINRKIKIPLTKDQNIMPYNIIYIDYKGHYATLHNKIGDDISIRVSQTTLEKAFLDYSFLQCCCKGIIVNFYEVSKQDNNIFLMKNGESIPISRRKLKMITDKYNSFIINKTINILNC